MKRKIVTAVIAFILCAAVVPTAGIYSVMAENEDTLQVEDCLLYTSPFLQFIKWKRRTYKSCISDPQYTGSISRTGGEKCR